MFALKRYKVQALCPIIGIETYIKLCNLLYVPIRQGFLFRATNRTADLTDKTFDSDTAQARLSFYSQQPPEIFSNRRVTPHGMRSGFAVFLALAGVLLESVMVHVGWETVKTSKHFIKMNEVGVPGGMSDLSA